VVTAQQAGRKLEDMVNIFDFDPVCKSKVSQMAYDYVSGAAWDEWTMKRNREAFTRITFRPRFFREVDKLDVSTTLFGTPMEMPILIAPTGTHALLHADGELATIRGAGMAGAPMVISTSSSFPIARIAAEAKTPIWFQLYTGPDLDSTRERVENAMAAGCKAICITVDAAYNAPRERDVRNKLTRNLPEHAVPATPPRRRRQRQEEGAPAPAPPPNPFGLGLRFQATLNWSFMKTLLSYAKVPVLVKGVLTADDARLAIDNGASGIIVSNHGGRFLDGAPATIDVLPEIVEAVNGRVPVLLDSGIRRGTDVLKAIALGARAVLVGRAPLWGLGAFGAEGVGRVMTLLRNELALAMALSGRPDIASIDRGLVRIDK
jgi:4-hydroxymandelate oxidase